MTKPLKILAGAILLLISAALLVPILIAPIDIRDHIVDGFAAATGLELQIAGNVKISVLPAPGVEIREASVAGAREVSGTPLAEIGLIRLEPRLAPLLVGRVELASIHVEGLRLLLVRDERGRANWEAGSERREASTAPVEQVAGTSAEAQRPAARPATEPSPTEAPGGAAPLVFRGVRIVNARVTWDDRQTGGRLELGDLHIATGPLSSGAPLNLRLSGSLFGATGSPSAALRAEARLSATPETRELRLEPLKLQLAGLQPIDGLQTKFDLTAQLAADLHHRRYQLDGLDLQVAAGGVALNGGRIDARIGARGALDIIAGTLRLEGLSIRADALAVDGHLSGQGLLTAPFVQGHLVLKELDLRGWLEERGLPTPGTRDPGTFRRVGLDTDWRLADDRLTLDDLTLMLDDTRITGSGELIGTRPVGYHFDLAGDRLDVDRYLPARETQAAPVRARPPAENRPAAAPPDGERTKDPNAATESQGPTTQKAESVPNEESDTPASPKPLFPVEALRALDLDGRITIGELRLARLSLGDAALEIAAKDGALRGNTRIGRFYAGRAEGKLGLDVRGKLPHVSLSQRISGAAAGPLLTDLTGNAWLTGSGNGVVDVTAAGQSRDALRSSLDGVLSLTLTEGSVHGFNLERLVREAEAGLTGKAPPQGLPNRTGFSSLNASGEIQGGVLSNRDLMATADHLRITGRGVVDLGRERFDYRFEPMFLQTPADLGIKELEGIPIPVHLTGPFDRPRWNVDAASALRAVAERELRAPDGGLFRKLEERTGIKGLEQGLRGLFGR
jgi:AsmA protein